MSALCVAASLDWIGKPFNGFLLGRNLVVAPIAQPSWTGPRAGIPFWSQLRAVDGRPVDSVSVVLAAAAAAGEGRMLEYTFSQGARATTLRIAVMRFRVADYLGLFANYLFNGLAFLALGFFVAFVRPRSRAARAMLLFSLSWGLSLIVSLADFASFELRNLLAVAEAGAPATLLYLSACFPDQHGLARDRRFVAFLIGISALLATLDVGLYDHWPAAWIASYEAGMLWGAAAVVASVALLCKQYRAATDPIAREKIGIVFLGVTAAFALPAALYLAGMLAGARVPLNVLPAVTWLFPASLAYAIVKRDLFEIDLFLRRAASYVGLSAAVLLLYVALLVFLSRVFHDLSLAASPWFTLVFSLGVLVVIHPLRDWSQAGIDRLFFRSRFDYAQITERLSRALTRTLDPRDVGAHVREAIATTMAPTVCRLYRVEEDASFKPVGDTADDLRLAPQTRETLANGRIAGGNGRHGAPQAPAGAALLVPLCFETRLEGLLLLGQKSSGAMYGPRDLDLLRTIANQSAVALHNVASYRRVTELLASLESRVEERTRELENAYAELRDAQAQLVHAEKMASLGTLVAGVAHEINNPVSFVYSSIDLISASVAELRAVLDRHLSANGSTPPVLQALRDELDYEYRISMLQENAAICRDGAERAASIVRDLRTFSRPAGGRREPTDVHSTLEQSLRLLQGEAKGRVTVVRDYGDVPAVLCDAGQMSQVFLNLVANAVQAIDGAGTVSIRTRHAVGEVRVEIEDSGRGMDEAVLRRLFDPFFTTKDVGKGTGLGLSIARSLVAAHGGEILVRSDVGRGSTFTVTLPVKGVEHEH